MDFLPIVKEYGPLGAVVVYFAWRDLAHSKRLANVDKWIRTVLLRQLKRNTTTMQRNTVLFERLENLLKENYVHSDQSIT